MNLKVVSSSRGDGREAKDENLSLGERIDEIS